MVKAPWARLCIMRTRHSLSRVYNESFFQVNFTVCDTYAPGLLDAIARSCVENRNAADLLPAPVAEREADQSIQAGGWRNSKQAELFGKLLH